MLPRAKSGAASGGGVSKVVRLGGLDGQGRDLDTLTDFVDDNQCGSGTSDHLHRHLNRQNAGVVLRYRAAPHPNPHHRNRARRSLGVVRHLRLEPAAHPHDRHHWRDQSQAQRHADGFGSRVSTAASPP